MSGLTNEQIAQASRMRDAGIPWGQVAEATGVPIRALQTRLYAPMSREARERYNQTRREGRAAERGVSVANPSNPRGSYDFPATKADAAALLAEIPEDTRSLTASICGDPLPNDRRREQMP